MHTKWIIFLTALALFVMPMSSQSTYQTGRHKFWTGVVPSSPLTVEGGTVYMIHGTFSTGGSSGTVTIGDRGSDCSGVCKFADTIAIAANSEYEVPWEGQIAPSGFTIAATGTVHAHIHYDTQLQ